MARCRFALTGAEWAVIELLLPSKPCGVVRVDDRRVISGIFWRFCKGSSWADIPRALWPADHLLQLLCALAQSRGVGLATRGGKPSLCRRVGDDRQVFAPGPPARCDLKKGGPQFAAWDVSGAVCRPRSTHSLMALACLRLHLSQGQASDCRKAKRPLAAVPSGSILVADKAYDRAALGSRITIQRGFANPCQVRLPQRLCLQQLSSVAIAIWPRAPSANTKTPEAHPPDTTGDATPCLMPSPSSAHTSGSPLMSLRPRILRPQHLVCAAIGLLTRQAGG
jgi:transposase